MIRFLTTTGTAAEIEKIVRSAQKELTLVSPYLQLSSQLAERMLAAEKRGATVRLVYGKERNIAADTRRKLSKLNDLRLFFYEDLHAKCYYSEEALVLTSMNLYEYSEKNNREMGIVASGGEAVYRDAKTEVEDIIVQAEPATLAASGSNTDAKPQKDSSEKEVPLSSGERASASENTSASGGMMESLRTAFGVGPAGKDQWQGPPSRNPSIVRKSKQQSSSEDFCIRCREDIPYNPGRPYCRSCFRSWAKWENPEYEEDYCHGCGREMDVQVKAGPLTGSYSFPPSSMDRPECRSCYNK